MIRSTLGAPLGGTTVGGQQGLDWSAPMLMTPQNGGGGAGRYFPSMVVVASGEPGLPVVCCCALADWGPKAEAVIRIPQRRTPLSLFIAASPCVFEKLSDCSLLSIQP